MNAEILAHLKFDNSARRGTPRCAALVFISEENLTLAHVAPSTHVLYRTQLQTSLKGSARRGKEGEQRANTVISLAHRDNSISRRNGTTFVCISTVQAILRETSDGTSY